MLNKSFLLYNRYKHVIIMGIKHWT